MSASMGAGHTGAARELSRRLETMGYVTTIRDFLDSGRFHIGTGLKRSYEFQLRHFPRTYEATYRMWFKAPSLCAPLARFVARLTSKTLMRWIEEIGPVAVVSTYPLATLALGELRRTGRIQAPVVNYITDFGVHPLWVHPSVDLNLAVHASSAERAALGSGVRSLVCAPAVSEAFSPAELPSRSIARSELSIPESEFAVLVAAGSWGVGSVEQTVREVADHPMLLPIVACGSDHRLRVRLENAVRDRSLQARVLGWTDDMPSVMSACDAVVENAGGLTAFEAMRAGLPVVTYRPIPGHGRENANAMASAGVASTASDSADLGRLLETLVRPGPARAGQVAAGTNMFTADPAEIMATVFSVEPPHQQLVDRPA
jgi:UDP-N-acetylglucosamine:LPS N-acetylglucosamine transferase